jgi:hypothetical protein
MARFYADEQFPRSATDHLRLLGHDVLTGQEVFTESHTSESSSPDNFGWSIFCDSREIFSSWTRFFNFKKTIS